MGLRRMTLGMTVLAVLLTAAAGHLMGFSFATIEQKISDFTLDNGLKFIVMEDHSAPVVSFVTLADVGGADDPQGYGGLAHVFEHMAFKGTDEIGTEDYAAEQVALDSLDAIYKELRAEELKGPQADSAALAALTAKFEAAQQRCDSLVVDNEFSIIVEREGGIDLNAGTGYDETSYQSSFPSNKLELWFALESRRFAHPVLRQLYKEKEVIKEERRMSTESSPVGRMVEAFLGKAFSVHPYGRPLVGTMADIGNVDKETAMAFFHKYYVPSNMIVAVVGDVTPKEIHRLAVEYFSSLPKVPEPERVMIQEPKQTEERRAVVADKSQPFLLMGFHRPSMLNSDDPVYDAIADYLGQGRTSMLYKNLVKEKKIATSASAFSSFPGSKYACQFGIFVVPAKGMTAEQCEAEVESEVEKLKSIVIPIEELNKIKARAKASFVNQLSSRLGMAGQLVSYQNLFGDWRALFNTLDKINAVTAEDIQRVARDLFTKENRTVAYIETTKE